LELMVTGSSGIGIGRVELCEINKVKFSVLSIIMSFTYIIYRMLLMGGIPKHKKTTKIGAFIISQLAYDDALLHNIHLSLINHL